MYNKNVLCNIYKIYFYVDILHKWINKFSNNIYIKFILYVNMNVSYISIFYINMEHTQNKTL